MGLAAGKVTLDSAPEVLAVIRIAAVGEFVNAIKMRDNGMRDDWVRDDDAPADMSHPP